jgi:nucleoside-diphosphate-sugar epimerase
VTLGPTNRIAVRSAVSLEGPTKPNHSFCIDMYSFADPDCDLRALADGDSRWIRLSTSGPTNQAPPSGHTPSTALIIGGNGFVGSHLLRELLSRPGWDSVICLVRDRGDCLATTRLERALKRFGDPDPMQTLSRLRCISGSYTEKNFGLPDRTYAQLTETVDAVFHVAGTTSFTASYAALRDDAVLSTLRLLDFCGRRRLKQVHYLSSLGVRLFRSPSDFRQHNWWKSGYARMKWVNTEIIRQAATRFGFAATAYHAPYVVGSTESNRDPMLAYSFWKLAVECARANLIWDGHYLQFIPVNLLCDVIAKQAECANQMIELVPSLEALQTREIAPLLGCQVIPAQRFFGRDSDALSPALRKFVQGTRYSDVENTSCATDLDQILDQEKIADPWKVFEAGWRRTPIQRAATAP